MNGMSQPTASRTSLFATDAPAWRPARGSASIGVSVEGPAHVVGKLQALAARSVADDDDVRSDSVKRFNDPDEHGPAADWFESFVPAEPAGGAASEDDD